MNYKGKHHYINGVSQISFFVFTFGFVVIVVLLQNTHTWTLAFYFARR